MKIKKYGVLLFLVLSGCAGFWRGCADFRATNFGSDWVVVQYRYDGTAFHCWKLRDTSISNENSSDGIYWQDSKTRHLVHVSGWYNRVQVFGGDYDGAGALLGVEAAKCGNGHYPDTRN